MKVIIAINDSPYSAQVVDSISHRRWPLDVEFKIVTVLEPLSDGFDNGTLTGFSDTLSAISDRRRRAARILADKARHKVESTIQGAIVHCEIREGMPRAEIINAAVDWEADRIVIGAHGKDVCPRYIPGSVSRGVVNHAPCTVEVVHPQDLHRNPAALSAAVSGPTKHLN